MGRIELAIFDIGGTIVDRGYEVPGIALEGAFCEILDTNDTEDIWPLINRHMGMKKHEHITLILRELGLPYKLSSHIHEDFTATLIDLLTDPFSDYLQGIVPDLDMVFEALREEGVECYLTTSCSKEIVDEIFVHDNCDIPIWLYPRTLTSSHNIPGKPSPFMIFEAMKLAHTNSVNKVVCFGDTLNDIRAAVNAGVIAVGVNSGVVGFNTDSREAAQRFLDVGADYVLDDLDGIPWLMSRLEEIDFSRPIMTGSATVSHFVNYFPHP